SGPRLDFKLFKSLQCTHHRHNWSTLPVALNGRLVEFTEDIKLPLANDALKQSLETATNNYRGELTSVATTHLDNHRDQIIQELRGVNIRDVEQAADRAFFKLRELLP